MTDARLQPVTSGFPILTWNGGAYLGCDAVINLLRSAATVMEETDEDPRTTVDTIVQLLRMEADNLECRAIAHTTEPK